MTEVRPAVSVIPIRDGVDGIELFVQHRQASMDFAPGAVVFPGGRCDPGDEAKGAGLPLADHVLDEHVRRWRHIPGGGDPVSRARTLVATGLREMAEETGLAADPSALVPWDRWVTPEGPPKRFDVAFFVLPVAAGTDGGPRHLTSEATHSEWTPAAQLLDDLAAGAVTMLVPTRTITAELLAIGTVAGVVAHHPVIAAVQDDRPGERPRPGEVRRPAAPTPPARSS